MPVEEVPGITEQKEPPKINGAEQAQINEVAKQFQAILWEDLNPEESLEKKRPLLAHYTTVQTLEKILRSKEVWFSNPLLMNDIDEVRFGVLQGNHIVANSPALADAVATKDRARLFLEAFTFYFNQFANDHVLDAFVFCLSEHKKNDNDGILSMWRAYGANGNGVAIVFDTAKLNIIDDSPLIFEAVKYGTKEDRIGWLGELVTKFSKILSATTVPDNLLWVPAAMLFERIKMFAIFTKHVAFDEEKEWRIVYMKEKDPHKKLASMFHYSVGARGIDPKLKFKVEPVPGVTAADLSLAKLTDRIILGPTLSTPLTQSAMRRMLEVLGHGELKDKLFGSTIPFRPTGLDMSRP